MRSKQLECHALKKEIYTGEMAINMQNHPAARFRMVNSSQRVKAATQLFESSWNNREANSSMNVEEVAEAETSAGWRLALSDFT